MPLQPPHFIRTDDPDANGRLTPAMFGGWKTDRLTAFVQSALDAAYQRGDISGLPAATQDLAAEQFVYWRAYDAALTEVTFAPERADLERLGSVSYDRARQIKALRTERDKYESGFLALIDPPAPARRRRITSGAVDIVRN